NGDRSRDLCRANDHNLRSGFCLRSCLHDNDRGLNEHSRSSTGSYGSDCDSCDSRSKKSFCKNYIPRNISCANSKASSKVCKVSTMGSMCNMLQAPRVSTKKDGKP